jgi:selenocysteine lyase/cysteine desulfurase
VLSGHKLYAPTGIGALYQRKELLESASVRASPGIYSCEDDIDPLAAALHEIAANRRLSAPRPAERA